MELRTEIPLENGTFRHHNPPAAASMWPRNVPPRLQCAQPSSDGSFRHRHRDGQQVGVDALIGAVQAAQLGDKLVMLMFGHKR